MRRVFAPSLLLFFSACGENVTHPDNAPYDAGVIAPLQCVPNLDGVIEARELKPVLDTAVKYIVSPQGTDRSVDVAGAVDGSGTRTWDFGINLASDQSLSLTATALSGKWYASSFPKGQFTTPFDAAHTLEAVYSQDDTALWLYGLASTDPSPAEGKTLLVYSQPVAALRFPVMLGSTWTETGNVVNATLRGLPYAGQDTYVFTDVAVGKLVVPDVTFSQAHRITSVVTSVPSAGESQTTRQSSYFFECFGEVTRATSTPNETNDDFTTAAEVRRFGL